VTRQEAAQKIAEKLNSEGLEAKVWTGGTKVRVYVTDAGKDCGFVEVGGDRKVTEKGCSSISSVQGCVSRAVCGLFGKREQFEDAPVAAEPTFHGVPVAKVQQLAREGQISTAGLTEDEIADAVKLGVISMSDAMNRDC